MHSYDLVLILKEENESLKQIEKLVNDSGGKIENREKWDKRRFAYPIKKEASGFYHFWAISLSSSKLAEFKKKLNVNVGVLRYLLLVKD